MSTNISFSEGIYKFTFTRQDAERAILEIKKLNIGLDVWINHTSTIDNIDCSNLGGEGDFPQSSAYHSDISLNYGFKFF